jgi:hypothetical protein
MCLVACSNLSVCLVRVLGLGRIRVPCNIQYIYY